MRVYLAGPVDPTLLSECLRWRREVAASLAEHGIEAADPTRGGNHPDPAAGGELVGFPVSAAHLVARDKADIRGSDLLLVYWPPRSGKRGIGTIMEIALAGQWSLPVLLVDPGGRITPHPWVQVHVAEHHPDLASAVARIAEYWS